VEVEEEHPHFALLAYLAEVASVRNPLPEEHDAVEEEVTHGSIEDILTAAALAESMKEEIFTVDEDTEVTMAEEDEDVDIMTLPGGLIEENQMPTRESVDEPQHPMTASPAKTTLENVMEGPQDILEQDKNSVEVPFIQSQIEKDDNAETTTPIEAKTLVDDDQDDWESLISYSEAEDNTVDQPTVPDQHISSEGAMLLTGDIGEMNNNLPSPSHTIGLNETGQFVAPQIKFFEDSDADQPLVQTRLSLDSTKILSFSTQQNLVTSLQKRQISTLNQPDNVLPPFHSQS